MRPALLVLPLLFGAFSFVHAQEQEKKLIDRILKPDMELENRSFDTTFYGGKNFAEGQQAAVMKTFRFENRVSEKSFQTKDFAASPYWAGDFKFDTRKADDGRRASESSDAYVTKGFAVKEAYDAGKSSEVREYGEATKDFRGKEADRMKKAIEPGKVPEGWKGNLAPMSLDDIRDLLNTR